MTEYYQDKDIAVRFEVFKDGKTTHPLNAIAIVYDPDGNFIKKGVCHISKNEVSYVLKGINVEKTGKYSFVFDVSIRWLGKYTHVVEVQVKKLPVKVK